MICFSVALAQAQQFQAGQVIGLNIHGLAMDIQGNPLMIDGDPLIHESTPIEVPMQVGETDFILSVFGDTISSLYLTRLGEDKTALNTHYIDISPVQGASGMTSVSPSPWGSLLISESIVPDARHLEEFSRDYAPYFGGQVQQVNAYDYGWLTELVLLDDSGEAKLVKHYGVGRVGATHLVVMPDQRTLYLYDGNQSGNLYMFIADEKGSLVNGRLSGMSFPGPEQRTRLFLAEGSSMSVRLRIKRAEFSKMFRAGTPGNAGCDGKLTRIASPYGDECLEMVARSAQSAAGLEPARAFALQGGMGAGTGFTGMEYDETSGHLLLSGDRGNMILPLVKDEELGTDYAVEVTQ